MTQFALTPRLVVRNAAKALDFYCEAFGAEVLERYEDPNLDNLMVHSEVEVGDTTFSVIDEHREWGNSSPESIGDSPVMLHVTVDDPDDTARRMQKGGAEIVIPIADQFYGRREGRVRDPFGHVWIVGKDIEQLSPEEIQKRVDEYSKT